MTHKWGDAIMFGSFRVHEQVTGTGKDKKVKGQGGNQRVLHTGENAAFLAGNRYGLPGEIACGGSSADAWANFVREMKNARPKAPPPAPKKADEKPPEEKKPDAPKSDAPVPPPAGPDQNVELDDEGNPIFATDLATAAEQGLFDNRSGKLPD